MLFSLLFSLFYCCLTLFFFCKSTGINKSDMLLREFPATLWVSVLTDWLNVKTLRKLKRIVELKNNPAENNILLNLFLKESFVVKYFPWPAWEMVENDLYSGVYEWLETNKIKCCCFFVTNNSTAVHVQDDPGKEFNKYSNLMKTITFISKIYLCMSGRQPNVMQLQLFLESFPNIRELEILHCDAVGDDLSFVLNPHAVRQLRKLDLQSCKGSNFSSRFFHWVGTNCTLLEEFALTYRHDDTDRGKHDVGEATLFMLVSNRNLKRIKLNYCLETLDHCRIFENMHEVYRLSVIETIEIRLNTDHKTRVLLNVEHLVAIVLKCKMLRHFDVAFRPNTPVFQYRHWNFYGTVKKTLKIYNNKYYHTKYDVSLLESLFQNCCDFTDISLFRFHLEDSVLLLIARNNCDTLHNFHYANPDDDSAETTYMRFQCIYEMCRMLHDVNGGLMLADGYKFCSSCDIMASTEDPMLPAIELRRARANNFNRIVEMLNNWNIAEIINTLSTCKDEGITDWHEGTAMTKMPVYGTKRIKQAAMGEFQRLSNELGMTVKDMLQYVSLFKTYCDVLLFRHYARK